MNAPKHDRRRRRASERRRLAERRAATDRRTGGGTVLRLEVDRREGERRTTGDRRAASHTSVDQIRNAINLLDTLNPDHLSDEDRRLLDTALFRLRFAMDRLADR